VSNIDRIKIGSQSDIGIRLDHFLTKSLTEYSRSQIQLLIRSGKILVNNKNCKTGYALELNDIISILHPERKKEMFTISPEPMDLEILYEDEDIAVINKPSGMVVHPGKGNTSKTLANGILHHFNHLSNVNGLTRPGIVHRLDKDTSGLILIAKSNSAHNILSEQFKNRQVKKEYYALTWGLWKEKEGQIDKPLQRDRKDPTRFCISLNGKKSVTKFQVFKEFQHSSLIKFFPKTGRTHQIRVHSASLGHPIFGDEKYGGGLSKTKGFINEYSTAYQKLMCNFDRYGLHAKQLEFFHPRSKSLINFESKLPTEFIKLVKELENLSGY
jgi:23S rRNA pseudouridine1911/1915/1917 synthase